MTAPQSLPYRPCVGVMLLNAQGRAFIGRRAHRSNAPEGVGKWWQMPQGGIDAGEDPEVAARRELGEETGIRSITFLARARQWLNYDLPGSLIGAWEGRYRGQTQLWFAARFKGEESEIDLEPKPGHEREFDAWRWAPLDELPEIVVPFKRQVYETVVEEFRGLV